MELEIWRPWLQLGAGYEEGIGGRSPWEYALLGVYVALGALLLLRYRADFAKLARSRSRSSLGVGLAIAAALAGNLFVVHLPLAVASSFPTVAIEPAELAVPLLGSVPLIAAGAWLGPGSAFVLGLLTGAMRSDLTTGGLGDPFCLAFLGAGIGLLVRQDYRGRWARAARQPVVAAAIVSPFVVLSLALSVAARVATLGPSSLEYSWTLTQARLVPVLIESLTAATVLQVVYQVVPRLRPVQRPLRNAPHASSMNRRFLTLVVPLVLIATGVLITAVTATTIRIARSQAIREMAQDAYSASQAIPQFIRTGQALLTEFAGDEYLRQDEVEALERRLIHDLRMDAFFDQLLLFSSNGQLLAEYPPGLAGHTRLTSEEQKLMERVLRDGTFQMSPAHPSPRSGALMSFIAPVADGEEAVGRKPTGALIGRTHLNVNPVVTRILTGLQWTSGLSEGLVIDGRGLVVAHSDSSLLLTDWEPGEDRICSTQVPRGEVCMSRDPTDQTLLMTYYLPADGYPWTVVIRLPFEVVLEEARQIAGPLLILQALFGVGLVLAIVSVTRRVTQPLAQLAGAADRIARGGLADPVTVTGKDEVGRVGEAFEGMRVRLKDRMSDLSLLLEILQAGSSTLELSYGVPFILEGALQATGAEVARAIFLSEEGHPQVVMSAGEGQRPGISAAVEGLDAVVADAVKGRTSPVVLGDLARAKALADPEMLNGHVRALIALPVRTSSKTLAVLWVGFGQAQELKEQKVKFLSTLASQTAVLLENARLFEAVEGEQRRLSALLDSIGDAVVVTDQDNRILLVNPAAEQAFDVEASAVLGEMVDETGLDRELADLLTRPSASDGALIEQTSLPDGRALYVNVSTIVNHDGQQIGRVAVMRDVTRFRQLDRMKSDFLATVSHDLRSPLTYMRGYADRLDAVGELNGKQHEHVRYIINGIDRIDGLVTDLLDLRRIEAGLGLEHEPCNLALVVSEAVKAMEADADAKGISLKTRVLPGLSASGNGRTGEVTVAGDMALLRQVIVNLLDNAIKYTPRGGNVSVELSVPEDTKDRAVISVVDDGIGIAPDEQVRLFEKFYRVKGGDRPAVAGTGLGLALVKSIVERHQGKVWVNSRPRKGSAFYISLPLLDRQSQDLVNTVQVALVQ
ncbi:MAG: ATP-binding protein [Anaerolineae bacterium]|jgi:PAS domain S-box-containing protein